MSAKCHTRRLQGALLPNRPTILRITSLLPLVYL